MHEWTRAAAPDALLAVNFTTPARNEHPEPRATAPHFPFPHNARSRVLVLLLGMLVRGRRLL